MTPCSLLAPFCNPFLNTRNIDLNQCYECDHVIRWGIILIRMGIITGVLGDPVIQSMNQSKTEKKL